MTKTLVTGYLTARRYDDSSKRNFVKHVAVFANGNIKITTNEFHVSEPNFNRNFAWESLETLPVDLEYIGQYPANM